MKVSLNQIGLNIGTAIDNGMIALPKLTNSKSINEFASKFTTDVMLAAHGRSNGSPFRAARKRCLGVIVSTVIVNAPVPSAMQFK